MFTLYSYMGNGESFTSGECFIDTFLKHHDRMFRICVVVAHRDDGCYIKSTAATEFHTAEAGNNCYKCFKASSCCKPRPAFLDKKLEMYGITCALKKIDYAIFREEYSNC